MYISYIVLCDIYIMKLMYVYVQTLNAIALVY